jgi:DNA-binding CsgD family transcriptional regulator
MLVETGATRDSLSRMISNMTVDATLREDLMQEALIHLWLLEEQRPGQTRSWYLQGCKFHLQHYLTAGRSVDSGKRRAGRVPLPEIPEDQCDLFGHVEPEASIVGTINAREIIFLLSERLSSQEKSILNCLADGMGAREIAAKLKVTHPTIIKYRRKIARLATQLGVSNLPKGRRANGKAGSHCESKLNGARHPNGVNHSRSLEPFVNPTRGRP